MCVFLARISQRLKEGKKEKEQESTEKDFKSGLKKSTPVVKAAPDRAVSMPDFASNLKKTTGTPKK